MQFLKRSLPKHFKTSGFVAGLLFAGLNAGGQQLLTPEEAVGIIMKNNYNVSVARNQAEIAAIAATRGNAGMLPSVFLNATGVIQSNDINQRFASGLVVEKKGVGADNINAQVGITWTLFDGGRMFFTYDRLKQQTIGAQTGLRQQIENSVEQTLNTYYTIVRLKQEVQARQFGLEVAEEQLLFANTRFEVGNGSRQQVLQATIDRNTWKSQLLDQNMQLENARLELNRLLARDLATEFTVVDSIPTQFTASLDDLRQKATASNASVLIANNNLKIAEYQMKEIRAGYLPTLNFIGAYGLTRTSSEGGFSLYNYSQGPNAGLQLTWNLFDGSRLRSQIKQSTLQLNSVSLISSDVAATVSTDVYIAYKTWQYAMQIRQLEEENFNAAKENVTLSLERQRVGSADNLVVKEAQRSYEEAISRVTTARLAAKQAELALMRLSGQLVK